MTSSSTKGRAFCTGVIAFCTALCISCEKKVSEKENLIEEKEKPIHKSEKNISERFLRVDGRVDTLRNYELGKNLDPRSIFNQKPESLFQYSRASLPGFSAH